MKRSLWGYSPQGHKKLEMIEQLKFSLLCFHGKIWGPLCVKYSSNKDSLSLFRKQGEKYLNNEIQELTYSGTKRKTSLIHTVP